MAAYPQDNPAMRNCCPARQERTCVHDTTYMAICLCSQDALCIMWVQAYMQEKGTACYMIHLNCHILPCRSHRISCCGVSKYIGIGVERYSGFDCANSAIECTIFIQYSSLCASAIYRVRDAHVILLIM